MPDRMNLNRVAIRGQDPLVRTGNLYRSGSRTREKQTNFKHGSQRQSFSLLAR